MFFKVLGGGQEKESLVSFYCHHYYPKHIGLDSAVTRSMDSFPF